MCKVCQRSYSTQTKLTRHKRRTSCGHSLPPEAKRQKLMPPIEDLEVPPLVDEYGSELQDVIIQHWGSIRTHASHGPVQSRYNIRLMTSDIGGLELGHIFARACVRACVRACTCVRACARARACVRACVRACIRTVCVQLTFQNGSHKKHMCVRACVPTMAYKHRIPICSMTTST